MSAHFAVNAPPNVIRPTDVQEKLQVCTMISNPARYKRRYELFWQWATYIAANCAVEGNVVELQQRDRPFLLEGVQELGLRWKGVRSNYELWHKENCLNIGFQEVAPASAKWLCWMDADTKFATDDWAQETVHELQNSPVVQMLSHSVDLGPDDEPILQRRSFAHAYVHGMDMTPISRRAYYGAKGGEWFHPGYAWAYRRDFLDEVGGLMELAIIGSADFHMAYGLVGLASLSYPVDTYDRYKEMVADWQDRSHRSARGNVGYVKTTCLHYWHGKKVDRRYGDRWRIITDNQLDPYRDVLRDSAGVLRLSGTKPNLRLDLQKYFRARNEDSIDL